MEIPRHFSAYKGELSKLYGFEPNYLFLDLTLGDGGHTEEALSAGCRVVSFDVDPDAITRAIHFVSSTKPIVIDDWHNQTAPQDFKWLIVQANFNDIGNICRQLNLPKFNGIMVDLGPSQYQVLSEGRGLSFQTDEPLDMRLDRTLGVTAADLLAVLNEGELVNLFALADESYAKPIAKAIIHTRHTTRVQTTKQLRDLISHIKKVPSQGHIHPATKVFMALRMAVNLERENLRLLLPQLVNQVTTGGVIGVISFHSGEDRLVKDYFKNLVTEGVVSAINKKPITPSTYELSISPRTRSAKLRLIKKII